MTANTNWRKTTMKRCLPIVLSLVALGASAQAPKVNGVEIRKDAKIDVVFYTADDCKYCLRWKADSKSDFLKRASKLNVGYREVSKPRIADPYEARHFPAEAGYAWKQMNATGRKNFMIPRWIVYADQQKVIEGAALSDWSRVSRFLDDVIEARNQGEK